MATTTTTKASNPPKTNVAKFRETSSGRIVYNLGVILLVFLFMSIGMNVFAERPGTRSSNQNPVMQYLWQMAHHHELSELGKQVDYQYGRIYLFKRMQGDASTWGWAQKEQYDQMYAAYREIVAHYNDLVAQYNGDDDPSQTGFAPKNNPVDYMPYATR